MSPCVLAALILAAPGRQPSSDWPTYHGGPALNGVADAAPPDSPVRLWRFKAGGSIAATPVSAGGRIFFTAAKGILIALDLDGRQAWKREIAKDSFSAPPMCADQAVIVGSANGVLYAFDTASGKERWSRKMADPLQGSANRVDLPRGKKGIVTLSPSDGSIHCIDLDSWEALWKTGPLERCDGSPGVGSGRIVIGSCASALHVFSVEKAVKEADIELGGDNQVAGGVALSGKAAFAGTRSGKVVAVDVVDHKVLWSNSDSKGETFATPAVNDRFVVFASDDGRVYGLNRETGVKLWDFDTGLKPLSPVIAENRVVVSSGGSLFLLELETGRKLWTVRVSDEITSPALVGGRVIVGADDGTVTAFGHEQK
jgi:outer membrane protein assembly factor BamB